MTCGQSDCPWGGMREAREPYCIFMPNTIMMVGNDEERGPQDLPRVSHPYPILCSSHMILLTYDLACGTTTRDHEMVAVENYIDVGAKGWGKIDILLAGPVLR